MTSPFFLAIIFFKRKFVIRYTRKSIIIRKKMDLLKNECYIYSSENIIRAVSYNGCQVFVKVQPS